LVHIRYITINVSTILYTYTLSEELGHWLIHKISEGQSVFLQRLLAVTLSILNSEE